MCCASVSQDLPDPSADQYIIFWLTVPSILIYFDFLASTSLSLVGMMTESWPICVSGIAEVKVLVMQH